MIAIMAFLLSAQQIVPPLPHDAAGLAAAGSRELADALLSDEQAQDVVSHRVEPSWDNSSGRHPPIRFFGRERQGAAGICRRKIYLVVGGPVSRLGARAAGLEGDEIRLGQNCDGRSGATFAHIQPGVAIEAAEAALLGLASTQAQARARARRGDTISVRCTSAIGRTACAGGGRATLARADLGDVRVIGRAGPYGAPTGWEFAIMPTGLGQAFYKTEVRSEGERTIVTMRWDYPPPF